MKHAEIHFYSALIVCIWNIFRNDAVYCRGLLSMCILQYTGKRQEADTGARNRLSLPPSYSIFYSSPFSSSVSLLFSSNIPVTTNILYSCLKKESRGIGKEKKIEFQINYGESKRGQVVACMPGACNCIIQPSAAERCST